MPQTTFVVSTIEHRFWSPSLPYFRYCSGRISDILQATNNDPGLDLIPDNSVGCTWHIADEDMDRPGRANAGLSGTSNQGHLLSPVHQLDHPQSTIADAHFSIDAWSLSKGVVVRRGQDVVEEGSLQALPVERLSFQARGTSTNTPQ